MHILHETRPDRSVSIELNNPEERTIRPIALKRKNALLAGHDAGAQTQAIPASLIETYKLNGIEPHGYVTGGHTAIFNGHTQSKAEKSHIGQKPRLLFFPLLLNDEPDFE